jgi:hypothetical protein
MTYIEKYNYLYKLLYKSLHNKYHKQVLGYTLTVEDYDVEMEKLISLDISNLAKTWEPSEATEHEDD